MQKVTSAEAQNRFGRLFDMAQREPVAITGMGVRRAMSSDRWTWTS